MNMKTSCTRWSKEDTGKKSEEMEVNASTDEGTSPDGGKALNESDVLSIEVETRCNQNCINCFARAGLDDLSPMPFETARDIALDGSAAGFRKLHLTGGEPLLWPNLFELLELAEGSEYKNLSFNTNGTLLNDEICKKLASYGEILSLSISINGPPEIHDSIRGEGAYDLALTGFNLALKYGLRVQVFTTITRDLVLLLPEFIKSLFENHPDIMNLVLIQNHRTSDDIYNLDDTLLSPEDFIVMVRAAALLSLYGYSIQFLENSLINASCRKMDIAALPLSPNYKRYGRLIVLRDGRITCSHSNREEFAFFKSGSILKLLNSHEYLK